MTKRIAVGSALALLLNMLLTAAAPAAEAQPTDAESTQPKRGPVFAHYMVAFFQSVEFYKYEIELAQRHGIDGWALNCGQWLRPSKDGDPQETNYVPAAERIFQAARELDSGFKLFFSADVNGLRNLPLQMTDMIERFDGHPNQFRHEGKPVISAWAGRPFIYAPAVKALEERGHEVVFVPFVNAPNFQMAWSPETVLNFFRDQPHMDGVFNFAADGTVNDLIDKNATGRRMTQHLGKLFMAGAAPAYNSPNLRDFRGMHGYGAMWEGIVQDRPDWVQIVTWNDYTEDSNLAAYRWSYPRGSEKDYFVRDESYLDATGYYSAWYRTGVQPTISQDKLYFTYRTRSRYLTRVWDARTNQWNDLRAGKWPLDQIHDDVADEVYVTSFLTAPAQVVVRLGDQEHRFDQPAGIAHASAPMQPGVPEFELRREGKTLASVSGRRQIIDQPTRQNSQRGYHLANRTWTAGVAVGDAHRLEAEAGQTLGAAATSPDGRGVTIASDGDGVRLALPDGLETATYNVRVTYTNPGSEDARLTLLSDGPPHHADDPVGYHIPMFLPPTGDQPRTVSLFWSLYDNGAHLTLQRQPAHGRAADKPGAGDYGQATIDAIELVKVEPVAEPEPADALVPELVEIPGGRFMMGSEQGEPDERPVREVAVDNFALGRFEVTNEQYERFNPEHRKLRAGFSWRDREPVIFVKWVEAAQYCNWLSEQTGLEPVYEQQQIEADGSQWQSWVANEQANGFRLPTEAQWEYAASGRGEGRTYPWGDQQPEPMWHGNFEGGQSLAIRPVRKSDPARGTTVVGSFPAGASRDGVMDMAGNVSEWTADRYIPTGGAGGAMHESPQPADQDQDRYRTMRGGSWGYYNHSQRVADREFNTAGYGGYIYIGFRVALPEEGLEALRQREE